MRVLLIEDDPDDALLMGEYLQDAEIEGVELIHADRLEQAVRHLAEHSAAVDVALLDLNLPDSRGLATVRAVVESASDVPVIVVTGLEDEDMALAAVNSGAQDYLVKGAVDEVVLRRAIRYAIERHRLERERARLAAELSDAQKMKALGLLAGGIAHDFNNMLTVIIGHCRLVRAEVDATSRVASSVAAISTAGERAAELTKRLLALGREELVAPRPVDANAIIGEVHALLGKMLGEDIRLELDLSEALWSCRGEKTQLTQVLVNLAVNARDAMMEGGTLTIETSNRPLGGTAEAAAQDFVAITVRDTGHGMDAETLERIFEPFFTTKERGVGTGLGLASVLAVIKRLGGFITVSSEVGLGTRFSILLPRCEDLPQQLTPPAAQATEGHETVLLVEDDDAVREFMAGVLEGAGYRVIAAASGDEALGRLGERVSPVQLLVTDLVMPGMNGIELTERVLRRSPQAEVILMSGYASDALLRRGMERGDFRLLEKPFDGEALLVTVRETLDRRASASGATSLGKPTPLSIVVVDDDPLVRVVLEASLQREGHEVIVLASPEEVPGALAGADVDVVITDVNVPGGGALRVLELIRAYVRGGERCSVVAISGDPRVGERMLEAGCDAFYAKPIDVGELSAALLSLTRQPAGARDRSALAGPAS
ncbi:MAG: response regulator [Myxococcales bacterium]|nr:response regulator [Myxococcales bacterium]